MIVISRNFGQLGNRLILASNLIAAAHEYDVPLVNPSFVEYAQYFCSTAHDLWCRFPAEKTADLPDPESQDRPWGITREVVYRCVYLSGRTLSHLRMTRYPFNVVRLGHHGRCDLTTEDFRRMAKSKRPFLVSGWHFKAGELLEKHADIIRDYFRIIPQHQANVDALMKQVRDQAPFVVGVHIRQGDYAEFRGGRYFYTTQQYVSAMRRIRRRFPNRQVVFLVCGNGHLHRRDFGDLNVCFGTGHLIEDMYSFAQCDLLVGPPSTYTGWASFYGNVPLCRMNSANETFDQIEDLVPPTPGIALCTG